MPRNSNDLLLLWMVYTYVVLLSSKNFHQNHFAMFIKMRRVHMFTKRITQFLFYIRRIVFVIVLVFIHTIQYKQTCYIISVGLVVGDYE